MFFFFLRRLAIERLEDTGVLVQAHTAVLEETLECWTLTDNVRQEWQPIDRLPSWLVSVYDRCRAMD